MANINNLLIEKVKEAAMFNSDGSIRWTAADVSNASINVTSTSTDKLDAMQNVISKLYQGKQAEVSFESAFFSLGLIAAQSGTDVVKASAGAPIKTAFREELTVGATAGVVNTTVTLSRTPVGTSGAEVKYIYVMNSDRSLGTRYEVDTTASATKFSISGKVITLPTGSNLFTKDSVIVVYYDSNVEAGASVTNTASANTDAGLFRMFVIFKDICNEETKYSGVIEFPSAQISPDCEIGLQFDSTYSYSLSANKKYCAADDALFKVYVPENPATT